MKANSLPYFMCIETSRTFVTHSKYFYKYPSQSKHDEIYSMAVIFAHSSSLGIYNIERYIHSNPR